MELIGSVPGCAFLELMGYACRDASRSGRPLIRQLLMGEGEGKIHMCAALRNIYIYVRIYMCINNVYVDTVIYTLST